MTGISQSQARFCSVCARQIRLQPSGHADSYDHLLVFETPLPWPALMLAEPGTLPDDLLALVRRFYYERPPDEPLRMRFLAIAPDREYSRPGHRRVISFRRPGGAFAAFTRDEYLVPEPQLGTLAWALALYPECLREFDAYRQQAANLRDLMICTHGTVDVVCGKFGFPLYKRLRAQAHEALRVWRVSHFGGHVFAPTLLDMPEARYWGFLGPEEADILAQRGDIERLNNCYRGWAAFDDPVLQAAECALLLRHGWPWVAYHKAGRVLDQSPNTQLNGHGRPEPAWAEVQIEYTSPDSAEHGAYVMRIELAGHVNCIVSSGDTEPFAYPQYVVTRIERVA